MYAAGVCWQSRYVLLTVMYEYNNGGKLVLERTWEPGKMVPEYLVEFYLDFESKHPVC